MFTVTFRQNGNGITAEAPGGQTILMAARASGVDLDAPCSGNGICGKCRVRVLSGTVEGGTSRQIPEEEQKAGVRLACESRIVSDVVIEIPDTAGSFRYGIVTADFSHKEDVAVFNDTMEELEALGIPRIENGFSMLQVTLDPPTLDDTAPDLERVRRILTEITDCDDLRFSSVFVRKAAALLRECEFSAALPVERKSDGSLFVYDILPPHEALIPGLSVDIGTTTVTGVLADLCTGRILARASAGNAQIRYGADVINRIIAACRPGGSEQLEKAVSDDTIRPMIEKMCADAGVSPSRIVRLAIAGNTTMNHLFTGVYADPIRMEPYIPTFFETDAFSGRDFPLGVHPDAPVLFAPNVGSYVGGDITAGTLVSRMWAKPEFSVFVDLGTNGEIVFGNEDFLMCCACSAGPAFEGGGISCGMRATRGAISALTIDPETMEPAFSVIADAAPLGLCGSGIIDTVSELFRCGIISGKGSFIREGERVLRDESGIGRYVIVPGGEHQREVSIDEVDISNFIRAKGAIFSAIVTMLRCVDMDMSMIEHIYIAGGIGSGLNIDSAVSVGMLPKLPEDCYTYLGNTSLAGAVAMLLSESARNKISELASGLTYLELSTQPGYMDEFVAACFLPHTDASLFQET
ncbi:MAG: DUF4445 domain-containing protein [Lachnospiraceae bacterium]|nr:DUF4445 domain-containing protein [Lachnospiraceae bacterium]